MRLTCPNCGAQYEVADDVIPPDGRDVQCSACETTWFQGREGDTATKPEPSMAELPETAPPAPAEDFQDELQDADFEPAADTGIIEETITETDTAPEMPATDESSSDPVAPTTDAVDGTEPAARELDPGVADILRQEADRERAARAAETFETQADLGLDMAEVEQFLEDLPDEEPAAKTAPSDDTQTDSNITAMMGVGAATATAVQAGRELLPDIEEINSTLRSTSDRDIAGDDPDPEAPGRIRKKRSFRRGFWLMLLLILIAVLIYIFAPQIKAAVPPAEDALNAYVTQIDMIRNWLDGQVRVALTWLDGVAASSND